MKRADKIALGVLAGAVTAFLLLACSGANGDSPPAESEAGADSGVIIITECGDASAE